MHRRNNFFEFRISNTVKEQFRTSNVKLDNCRQGIDECTPLDGGGLQPVTNQSFDSQRRNNWCLVTRRLLRLEPGGTGGPISAGEWRWTPLTGAVVLEDGRCLDLEILC